MGVLLQVRYLIFLLPLGVSVFLLIASMLFSGGDDDNAGDGSDGAEGGAESGGGDFDGGDAGGDGDFDGDGTGDGDSDGDGHHHSATTRTPRSLLLNGFSLAWGVFGMGANQVFFPQASEPGIGKFWPVLVVALFGGLAGAWAMKQFASRLMPGVQTQTVSRDALFGLTGTVLFAVSQTGGRIRVYDEFGSMHDESCRVAANVPAIAKGKRARIADRDAAGRLLVEEV